MIGSLPLTIELLCIKSCLGAFYLQLELFCLPLKLFCSGKVCLIMNELSTSTNRKQKDSNCKSKKFHPLGILAIVRAWYTMENGPNAKMDKKKVEKLPDRKRGNMGEKYPKMEKRPDLAFFWYFWGHLSPCSIGANFLYFSPIFSHFWRSARLPLRASPTRLQSYTPFFACHWEEDQRYLILRVPQKECGKRSSITFSVFGTLSVTFRSLFLMLLSLFSSLFCRTPFAGLLLPDSFCGRVRFALFMWIANRFVSIVFPCQPIPP